jgi:lysophospholipase L1-like esterase
MSFRNTRLLLVGIVIGVVLDATVRYFLPDSNQDQKKHGRPLIIAYGDSITQRGYAGWLGLLSDWYTRKVDILNRGFSGYQSRWGFDMFPEVVLQNSVDMVIIFFGANDAVVPEVLQHVPLKRYEENLLSMAKQLKEVRPTLFLWSLINNQEIYRSIRNAR